ncbi:MAG: hypothetical protein ACYC41_14265, partial [Bacillota bacterium]
MEPLGRGRLSPGRLAALATAGLLLVAAVAAAATLHFGAPGPRVVRHEGRLTIGPVQEFMRWVGPNLLAVGYNGLGPSALIDVEHGTRFSTDGLPQFMFGAPDGSAVAFIRDDAVVIRRLRGSRETGYAFDHPAPTWATVLSWSPNGRFIVGEVRRPSTPAQIDSRGMSVTHLWVLDLEAGRLAEVDLGDAVFSLPQWSPAGDRIAVQRVFEETWPASEWLEVDLTPPRVVATFPYAGRSPPRLTWDATGRLEVRLPGEGGLRAQTYDPVGKTSSDGIIAQMPFVGTELRFLKAGDELFFSLDLRPALEEAGIPVMEWLHIHSSWSPDGRYLLLEGQATDLSRPSERHEFIGAVDVATRTVRLMPPTKWRAGEYPAVTFIQPGARWSGDLALVSGPVGDRRLMALNVA